MRKLLKPSEKILLALALFGDAAVDFVKISAKSRRRGILFTDLSENERSRLSKSVWYLLQTGDIRREVKKGEAFLTISPEGERSLPRRFSLKEWRKKWDGIWLVVGYDIPEKLRDRRVRLREKLTSLGFGRWQKSVYISPYSCLRADLIEWVRQKKLGDFVSVTESKGLSGGDEKKLARKVFRLEKIADEYSALLDDISADATSPRKAYDRFVGIVSRDPYLPTKLLPEGWVGYKLEDFFKRVNLFK